MIIYGLPVSLRRADKELVDFIRTWTWLISKPVCRAPFLHLIYFSCARDFHILCLSLESAFTVGSELIKQICIWVDEKDPFTGEQLQKIQKIAPGVMFERSRNFAWASMGTLETELNAFAQVGKNAEPNEFLVKVDSDVLFISMEKVRLFPSLNCHFIGDGHHEGYSYAQGGLYFIRSDLACKLGFAENRRLVNSIVSKHGSCAEDLVIYNTLKEMNQKSVLTRLMLYPNEYDKVNLRSRIISTVFVAIHFVHRKHEMPRYADMIERRRGS